ncbi:MAG: DUF4154 domain-containing protein [Candidatus Aminicenantes bacterium]|nr:DUF4154 domain-containing protein [Candidatus Aminicenantes bacterium]
MSFFRRAFLKFRLIIFIFIILPGSFSQIIALSLETRETRSQQYYLQPTQELRLLKKVLTFERNWKARAETQLIIGILYQKSNSLSYWVKEDWLKLSTELPEAEKTIDSIPIVFKEIHLDSVSSLEKTLAEEQVQLLYITPIDDKKSPKLLRDISRVCQKLKIGTFSGVVEYLDSGVAMVFGLKENKAQIFINLEASKEQGLNFSSQFLRIVKIRNING